MQKATAEGAEGRRGEGKKQSLRQRRQEGLVQHHEQTRPQKAQLEAIQGTLIPGFGQQCEDFERFLRLLQEEQAEFVIVGGYAVAFHGYLRATLDMDLFFRDSRDNVRC